VRLIEGFGTQFADLYSAEKDPAAQGVLSECGCLKAGGSAPHCRRA